MNRTTVLRFGAAVAAMYVGAMICWMVSAMGCSMPRIFAPPDPNAVASGLGAAATPFARDLRTIGIPLVWACAVFAVVSFVLSKWVGVFSAKTSLASAVAAVVLLYSINFLTRYEWVLHIAVLGSLGCILAIIAHAAYLKYTGKEGSGWSDLLPAFVRKWFAKPSNV